MPDPGCFSQRLLWLGKSQIPWAGKWSDQALRRKLTELHQKYPTLGLDSLYYGLRGNIPCPSTASRKEDTCWSDNVSSPPFSRKVYAHSVFILS